MNAVALTTTYRTEECIECGVSFAVTSRFQEKRRQDHKNFCCPWGHWQHYAGKSDVEKAREATAKERDRAERAERNLTSEHQNHTKTKHQLRAQKAAKTRLKNAAAAGECPCCGKTYKRMAAHMAKKHPGFTEGDE